MTAGVAWRVGCEASAVFSCTWGLAPDCASASPTSGLCPEPLVIHCLVTVMNKVAQELEQTPCCESASSCVLSLWSELCPGARWGVRGGL